MSANTWIKTLNARLLTEPSWTFKAGYLAALIAASLLLAAFLMLRLTFSFVGFMVVQTAKNFARTRDSEEFRADANAVDDSDEEVPRWGSEENGYRTDGHYYVDGIRLD